MDTRALWISMYRSRTGSTHLQPIGLDFRVNVYSTTVSEWFVDMVWFRGITFANMNEVVTLFATSEFTVTIDGNCDTSTDLIRIRII